MLNHFGIVNQDDFVQVRIANVTHQAIDRTKDWVISICVVIHTNVKHLFVEFKLVVHHGNGDRSKRVATVVAMIK